MQADAGVSRSDAAALVTLRNYAEGEPLDLLRRALALSHPGVVRLADRLQARRLVERRRGDRDGRAVALRLTAAGRRAADSALAARADAIDAALETLDAGQRRALAPMLERMLGAQTTDSTRASSSAACATPTSAAAPSAARSRRPPSPSPDPGRGRLSTRSAMDLWSHDRFTFPLPANHRFPGPADFARLRAHLKVAGIASPDEIHECEPVPWEWIEAVQQRALVERLRAGTLSVREQRGLGLPWSAALVERARRTTAGTVAAARHALARASA